jgi:hypothetical protein
MLRRAHLVERAYELARSGEVANVDQLITELKREHYEQTDAHLAGGSTLGRELHKICRAAWLAAGKPVPRDPRRRLPRNGSASRPPEVLE